MNRVLIFAGGTGQRMTNASVPKQFLNIHQKPIIVHTIENFQQSPDIDSIVVVCLESYMGQMVDIIKKYGLTKVESVVAGGASGQQSIFNGLKELVRLHGLNSDDLVLIHDGVRPVVDQETISANIIAAKQYGNAITVSKSVETILLLDDDYCVSDIMDRNYCNKAQAPQTFFLKDIYAVHNIAIAEGKQDAFIDSASIMHHYGVHLNTVAGPINNIKITTPMDYYLYKAILDAKEDEQLRLL